MSKATKLTKKQKAEVKEQVKEQVEHQTKQIELKLHKKLLNKSKSSVVYLGSQFKQHATTAIIAAFGFLIALSWKDFLILFIKENIKAEALTNHPYLAQLYSAIIITIIAIVGIAIVSKWAQSTNK